MRGTGRGFVIVAAMLGTSGCDGGSPTEPYDLVFDPSRFVAGVTNPYFPLIPGTTYSFRGDTDEGVETVVVEVTSLVKTVQGISATVVRDRVYLDGDLVEDTYDWFAQDVDGNVWYLGEDSHEIENGVPVNSEGSWEAGVGGALPGIYMWADPSAHVGEAYFQEYFPGEAMDKGRVLGLGRAVQVPAGSFTDCVETEDWNPLEGNTTEHKFYCRGVGLVKEVGGSDVVVLTQVAGP